AGELLLESLFPAVGLESLRAVPGRLGVRSEVLAGGTVAGGCPGISEIGRGRAHRRPRGPRAECRAESTSAGRPGAGFLCARFIDGQWPSLEGLIFELAYGFLRLLRIRELNESKASFFPGLAIERNGNIRKIP